MQTASSLIESDVIKRIAKNIADGAASARYIYEGGSKPNNKKNKRKIRKNNN
jgi:hypothetical protein